MTSSLKSIETYLYFKKEDNTTVASAACCARYASAKFNDIPVRLTRHKTRPKEYGSHQSTRQDP